MLDLSKFFDGPSGIEILKLIGYRGKEMVIPTVDLATLCSEFISSTQENTRTYLDKGVLSTKFLDESSSQLDQLIRVLCEIHIAHQTNVDFDHLISGAEELSYGMAALLCAVGI